MIVKGEVVGELDIDSHTPAAFAQTTASWWNIAPIWSALPGEDLMTAGLR